MSDTRATILIIDDNPAILETMGAGLEVNGFRVITAVDGFEGLARIRRDNPALVVLDIRLPGKDGCEVSNESKSDAQTNDIPLILITGDQTVDIDRGFALGADDCILKPVDMDYLILRIRKLANIKARVLRIDDDIQVGGLLLQFLEKQGYEVKNITDTVHIVEVAVQFRPQLVLLNIMMADAPSGIEACRRLKSDLSTKHIPVIMVATDEYDGEADGWFEYGAVDCVTKPFKLPELLQLIKKYAK